MKTLTTLFIACSLSVLAQKNETGLGTDTFKLADGSEVTIEAKYKVDVKAKAPADPLRRRMAIFVKNTAGPQFDTAAQRLCTQVSAQAAGSDFEIIDYTETVTAIRPLLEGVQSAESVAQLDKTEVLYKMIENFYGKAAGSTAGGRNATQDEKLLANTSFTRLAENMSADYVMMLSLDRFSKTTKTLRDKHITGAVVNEIYKITGTYKVLDTYSGSAIGGGTVNAQRAVRQTAGSTIQFDDYGDGLEEDLAQNIVTNMKDNAQKWRLASLKSSGIKVTFVVTAYDMNNKPIYLPKYEGANNIVTDRIPATIAANIEIDGVTKGSTTCTIPLSSGLHKVRLSRPGYDDVAMTITPSEGLQIAVNLRMTEGEYARIKDTISFMQQLTIQRELSQAEVKRIEGHAKMLEQSGFRIDAKSLPNIQWRSLL